MNLNFNDLLNNAFKSNLLESLSTFSALDMAIAMLCSLALGLFIFLVYKKTYTGVMYSAGFGASLLGLTLVTTLVILAVTSNLVLSLGMVGALSIVRFRTAIKEPLDIVFLFWSIAAGIVIGAGLLPLAILGTLLIGLILVVFVNRKSTDNPYVLILACQDQSIEDPLNALLAGAVRKHSIKSKTLSGSGMELTMEVRLKNGDTKFLGAVQALPGIYNAALVSYNGDYMA